MLGPGAGENEGNRGSGEDGDVRRVIAACLSELASSEAEFLMVNLEDLWEETVAQNTPGTVSERNWRHKSRHSLEEIRQTSRIVELLRTVNRFRKAQLETDSDSGNANGPARSS